MTEDTGNVIDFASARERMEAPEEVHVIQRVLDMLALALADHDHEWTEMQRWWYETATMYIATGRQV